MKVQTALRLSQEDQDTIASLKRVSTVVSYRREIVGGGSLMLVELWPVCVGRSWSSPQEVGLGVLAPSGLE